MMNRQNFGRSGTIVDACARHRTFLDRAGCIGAKFILEGGFSRMRQAELERLKEEQQRLRELEMHLQSLARRANLNNTKGDQENSFRKISPDLLISC